MEQWHTFLSSMMVIVTTMFTIREIYQMQEGCKIYCKSSSNWIDLISIAATLGVAVLLWIEANTNKLPWLVNFVHMVVLITWFQFCKDMMGCLPVPNIALNLTMWQRVAQSYLKIIACFAPFLLGFAFTFNGKWKSPKGPICKPASYPIIHLDKDQYKRKYKKSRSMVFLCYRLCI